MVSSAFTSPHEECNEELITMEEFINKMRSFNELEEDTDYPKDPNNYVYKIEVHNIFKRVHLIRAYETIEDKFDDYSSARWNDTTTPSHASIVTRMKELLDRCMYDHALKRIVYIAIIQSGQNDDDDESDSDSDSSDGE
jgi:hypothetical protein